jgi:hypothetical protein
LIDDFCQTKLTQKANASTTDLDLHKKIIKTVEIDFKNQKCIPDEKEGENKA